MKLFTMNFIFVFLISQAYAAVDERFTPFKLNPVFEQLNYEKTESLLGEWKLVGEAYQKGSYLMSQMDFNGLGTTMEIAQASVAIISADAIENYALTTELFSDFGNSEYPRYICKYQKTPIETILCLGHHGSGRISYKCFVRNEITDQQSCLFL